MNTTKKTLSSILCLVLLLSVSCKNGDPDDVTPNEHISTSDQMATGAVLEVERFINEAEFIAKSIKTGYPNQPGILSGATITTGQTEEGKTKFDIVFNNTLGADNKRRSGKVSVVFENAIENGEGKHLHVQSDDENQLYSVNEIKFQGSLIFSNISSQPNNVIDHLNAQSFLLKSNGEKIKFASTRKSKWITGAASSDLNDDIYEISEQKYSLDIIGTKTDFVQAETQSIVTLTHACPQTLFTPLKGKMKIEHLGGNTRSLSFGNGNCGDQPTILK